MWPLTNGAELTTYARDEAAFHPVPNFRALFTAFSRTRLRCKKRFYNQPLGREHVVKQMLRQAYRWLGNVAMARQPPKDPMLVIVGATGTGKSQVPSLSNPNPVNSDTNISP